MSQDTPTGPWNVLSDVSINTDTWALLSVKGGAMTGPSHLFDFAGAETLDSSHPMLRWGAVQAVGGRLRLRLNVLQGVTPPRAVVMQSALVEPGEALRWIDPVYSLSGEGAVVEALPVQGPLRAQPEVRVERPLTFGARDVFTVAPARAEDTVFRLAFSTARQRYPALRNAVPGVRSPIEVDAAGRLSQRLDLRELAVYSFFAWRDGAPASVNLLHASALGGEVVRRDALGTHGLGEQQFLHLGEGLRASGAALPMWARVLPLLGAAARAAALPEVLTVRPGFTARGCLEQLQSKVGQCGDVAPVEQAFVDVAWLTLSLLSARPGHEQDSPLPRRLQLSDPVSPEQLQTRLDRVVSAAMTLLGRLGRHQGEDDLGAGVQGTLLLTALERLGVLVPAQREAVELRLRRCAKVTAHPQTLRALIGQVKASSTLSHLVGCNHLVELLERFDEVPRYCDAEFTYLHELLDLRLSEYRVSFGEQDKPVLLAAPRSGRSDNAQQLMNLTLRQMMSGTGPEITWPFDFLSTLLYYSHDDKYTVSSPKAIAFKVRLTS